MKTRKLSRIWAVLLIFVLTATSLTGCSSKPSAQPTQTESPTAAPSPTPAPEETPQLEAAASPAPGFVQDESLILYIANNMLTIGGDGTLEVTVLCGSGVKDNIDIVDDTGAVLYTIENTSGGRQYETTMEVSTETERVGTLTARTGNSESTPRKFYIYPEVTEEMVARLDEAGASMLEYVASCDFEDAHSDDAYQQVADWLNQQEFIDYAEINGDGVLFRTADGLMGGYGYQPTEGYLGSVDEDSESGTETDYGIFADPERVFEDWLNGKKSSADLLESQIPITNNNYLVWAGDYGDDTIHEIADRVLTSLILLAEYTDGTYSASFDRESSSVQECSFGPSDSHSGILEDTAYERIKQGNITDYGFLILCGHGITGFTLKEEDIPYFAVTVGENTPENLQALGYSSLYCHKDGTHIANRVNAFIQYDTNIESDDGELEVAGKTLAALITKEMNICITVDFFEQVLGNKIFDNTIIFLEICEGMRDPNFYNLLLDHGASAVIGFDYKMWLTTGTIAIYEIVNSLICSNATGKYGTLSEGLQNFESDFIFSASGHLTGDINPFTDITLEKFAQSFAETALNNRQNILEDRAEGHIHIETREMSPAQQAQATVDNPYANRQFLGYGLAAGAVVGNDGEPIVDAEVGLYRWLNHDFILHKAKVEGPVQDGESPNILPVIAKTNERGEFSIKNVPYGLYVAYAEKDGRYGFTPFFVQAPDNEVVVTIKDNPFIMTTGVQEYVTPKISAEIARPTFSLEGNEFVDNLGEMVRSTFDDATVSVDEMLASPIYDGRKHISIAGVNDIHVTDRYVSVQVGSYQEFSNSAHGMNYWETYTYWLDTGKPVQLRELLDPSVKQASYRLRTLWRNAIYHKGITDEQLWQPLELTLEAALLGDVPFFWHFNDEGLNLQFPLYEVGPYAVGSLEITLPYHRLVYVIAPEFLPIDPPDELTVEDEPVSASVMPVAFGKDYKHRFQEANELAIAEGQEAPHPVYGQESETAHLIAVDGYAKDFRIYIDPPDYSEPIILFFASTIENALVWLPDLEDDTYEAVWEADGVTRSVTLSF